MLSCSNASGASPGSPAQPTQAAPSRPRMTDSMAVTRPPGLRRQVASPSGPTTRSTGNRLAAMTRSNVGVAVLTPDQLLRRGMVPPYGYPAPATPSLAGHVSGALPSAHAHLQRDPA